ncbi:hypothetical protein J2794_003112 [Paraburkholderia terricola]|nr:hypothetical protein [Paraburkholderia terricola]
MWQKNSPSGMGRAVKRRCYSGQPARCKLGADGSILRRRYPPVEMGLMPIYQTNVASARSASRAIPGAGLCVPFDASA